MMCIYYKYHPSLPVMLSFVQSDPRYYTRFVLHSHVLVLYHLNMCHHVKLILLHSLEHSFTLCIYIIPTMELLESSIKGRSDSNIIILLWRLLTGCLLHLMHIVYHLYLLLLHGMDHAISLSIHNTPGMYLIE